MTLFLLLVVSSIGNSFRFNFYTYTYGANLMVCAVIMFLLMCFVCAVDNSRVVLTGASNDYINASHLKVSLFYSH